MPRRAPETLVCALDIGSSSTRSALFDEQGRMVAGTEARRLYELEYAADGTAQLSPALLRRAMETCLRETLRAHRSLRLQKIPIAAVSGSAFWHGLLGTDGKGRPLTPVFTWADSRATRDAAELRQEFDERQIQAETGCMLRASFWPAKLRWLRRTNERLFRSVKRWVAPADWLFQQIFGGSGTSDSMASATGLYDWRIRTWHRPLGEACGIDPATLEAISETHRSGTSRGRFSGACVFNAIGDGAAGNLGCGADRPGIIALNIGTSAAVRMVESAQRRRPSIPFGLFRYALDRERTLLGGAVSNAGNLRRWCSRQLRVRDEEKALRRDAAPNDPLTVLPFWVAERAPTWPEQLRGTILGLSQAIEANTIFRAAMGAVFYRLAEILELLETAAGPAKQIVVSGGILRSSASLELLADALGRDVHVSAQPEASLRGAATYALGKLGYEPARLPNPKKVRPKPALAAKHRLRRADQIKLEKFLTNLESGDLETLFLAASRDASR